MPPPLRVPWVIDAAGTWMRAADAPAGHPLFCPVCGHPVILKRGPHRRWHAAHASGVACAPDGETYLHRLAKCMIVAQITAWRDGQASEPILRLPCLGCAEPHPVPLPDALGGWDRPIHHAHAEYRLADGLVPDIAVCDVHDHPMVFVEVRMTHAVSPDKAQRLTASGIPWVEVDARAWMDAATPVWPVLNGWLPPFICAACAQAWSAFRAAAAALASRWDVTLPSGPPYRYGIATCWKCHTATIVVTWPGEPPSLPAAVPDIPLPPLRAVYAPLSHTSWWLQPCMACGAYQLWYHRVQAPNAPFRPLRTSAALPAASIADPATAWLRDMLRIARWWRQ